MRKILLVIIAIALLASCASKKGDAKKDKPPKDPLVLLETMGEFEPLIGGASLYVSMDTKAARPILDLLSFEGMTGKDAGQILGRTSTLTAAVYPDGSPQRFLAAAKGNYPKTLADFSLAIASDWKKVKSDTGASYWRSDTLAVAFNSAWALASDKDPFVPTQALTIPGVVVPAGFDTFRSGSIMAGWLGDANTSVNKFLSMAMGDMFEIAAKQLFFAVTPAADKQYDTLIRIETSSEDTARGFVRLFTFARLFIPTMDDSDDAFVSMLTMLFANLPQQDGAFLNLRLGPMTAERIALLFNTFSQYSKRDK